MLQDMLIQKDILICATQKTEGEYVTWCTAVYYNLFYISIFSRNFLTCLFSHILTCGQDGDVRIWAGLDDDDSTSQCVGEKAIAVAHKVKNIKYKQQIIHYTIM